MATMIVQGGVVPEAGYARIYDSENGWSTQQPISVTHSENSGLIVTNGQRTVVDSLISAGFAVSSIEVYGNDETRHLPMHTLGILLFKHFTEALRSHRFILCAKQQLGSIGGLVIGILIFKKRKPSD